MPHNANHLATQCKSGCLRTYEIRGAPDGFSMDPVGGEMANVKNFAPWIEATIGATVTVGNESFSADPNTAVIKSLEFGFGNMTVGKMEIVDEKGGEMGFFLRSLQGMEKCPSNIGVGGSLLEFQVGWTGITCDGEAISTRSPKLKSAITRIQSSVSNGLIKFIIEFAPAEAVLQTYKIDKTFGTEENPMKMERAIRALGRYTEGGSPEVIVKFAKRNAQGDIIIVPGLNWENHGIGGPEACWKCENLTKYEAISNWVAGYRVKEGPISKGVLVIHEPQTPNEIIILQDPTVDENEKQNPTIGVGNFIVNGGKCSNVLEFNPVLDIVSVMAKYRAGGSSGGALKSDGEFAEDEKKPTPAQAGDDAGAQQQIVPSQHLVYSEGTKNAQNELNKSQEAHLKAEAVSLVAKGGITAQLRIVGTTLPDFYALNVLGKACSITIINPFHIEGGEPGRSCGDFTKKADCNVFLSNKNWQINGWSHSIQEGSFVTTLSVLLAAPQFDGGTSGANTLGANETGIPVENTC